MHGRPSEHPAWMRKGVRASSASVTDGAANDGSGGPKLLGTAPDLVFMSEALELARAAASMGEVPVGAVAVHQGRIIGRGHNRREIDHDPFAHAELIAMREASQQLQAWRLSDVTVYVTLEPCAMCAGAMVQARLG